MAVLGVTLSQEQFEDNTVILERHYKALVKPQIILKKIHFSQLVDSQFVLMSWI